jgi:hypothetical protein
MSADKTDPRPLEVRLHSATVFAPCESGALGRQMMHTTEQLFRCFPVPIKKKKTGERPFVFEGHEPEFQASSAIAAEISLIGAPWAGPMLIIDFETLTGAHEGQGLRFGSFQERGFRYDWRIEDAKTGTLTREKLDRLWHEGLVYEPKNCTPEEIKTLKQYAKDHKLELYTREDFIKKVFFRNHVVKRAANWKNTLREPCLVIGHNLPFDLGALAVHCGLAMKDLYGGLSLILQGQNGQHERRVAIKKLGFTKHLFRGTPEPNGSMRWEGETQAAEKRRKAYEKAVAANNDTEAKRIANDQEHKGDFDKIKPRYTELVEYLDTQTVARSLLGPGTSSMKDLLRRLNVPKAFQKESADYHGPITPEYIGYCRSDVENTWQILKALRELYKRHGRSKAMQKLYSEASLGKAYLDDFGIRGFSELNPAFDPIALGCFMESYYGGRCEVRIRIDEAWVIHCDFKSQYPTVNALMGLQELLIAKEIGVRTDSPKAKLFLNSVTLDDLRKKETWRKLRGVALIAPDDDILPYRARYGEDNEDGSLNVNIGVNRVITACPQWCTFADVIESKLLRGKTPKILKTLKLYPIGRQETKIIKLFGDDKYEVDLTKDDLFTMVIDARIDVQDELANEATPQERKVFLASLENALKLLANSSSYGVLNEFIADDRLEEVPTIVYHGGKSTKVKARAHKVGMDGTTEISDYKVEKAGKFFAPFGTLIPAAGRLLLAIAEKLAADRGLTYAFCDTDSMAFANYAGKGLPVPYSWEEFQTKVCEITDWFQPLNPYKHDVRLFNFEKANYRLTDSVRGKAGKELEPLFCVAISAKRYCLFIRDDKGEGREAPDFELRGPAKREARKPERTTERRGEAVATRGSEGDENSATRGADRTEACRTTEHAGACDEDKRRGRPIIRKASAHGLGDVMLPAGYTPQFTHLAAPVINDKGELVFEVSDINKASRRHSALVAGSGAALFLDMWYAAITELDKTGNLYNVDKIVRGFPCVDQPQHSQTSLSTRDAWLHYQSLPNRRAFQFMTTLPAITLNVFREAREVIPGKDMFEPLKHEIREAEKTSLYTPKSPPRRYRRPARR